MLLEARDLEVRYGSVRAVRGLSLQLAPGEIVAVRGANGAGKSSLLRALLGLTRAHAGKVAFDGNDVTRWSTSARVRAGLVLVPEGRRIVMGLTVQENLLMGAGQRRDSSAVQTEIEQVYQRFPNLAARRHASASVLSGGEQQMLAIGRALLAAPKLMMLDEPSLGLSPRLANEVLAHVRDLNRERGLTILLVEQNTQRALEIAHRAYLLELGQVLRQGPAAEIAADHSLLDAYLGRGQAAQRPTPAQLTT
ncbi:MAG: ABC transporter ATP-binding protein [Xanthobacteraceae bacterium]|nr:ABC transporter ATP-binding protein [Xanthobacteraceae bacterium]